MFIMAVTPWAYRSGDEHVFLERMGAVAPHRIFIPHIHEDDEYVTQLRDMLNTRGREADVSAIDSTSPNNAHDPDYIMSDYIRRKVEWCEAIVVLVSPETQGSDWVDKEIELAKELGKAIIGVYLPGAEGCPLPEGLADYAHAVVTYDEQQILGALDGAINTISDGAGNTRPSTVVRHNC